MSKLNYYSCPNHWTAVAKAQPNKNRTARRYVQTMNPGKPLATSIPLYYVLKEKDLYNYKTHLATYLKNRSILINDKVATEKAAPVGLLDYVTILDSKEDKSKRYNYQLYFEKNDVFNVKYYPTLKPTDLKKTYPIKKYYIGPNDSLKVQTFQGNVYTFEHNKENIDLLKNLFCFVEVADRKYSLVDYSKNYKLLKVIRITGTNKFKSYSLQNPVVKTEDPELRMNFTLKSKLGNLKTEIMSKGEFLKRYTYLVSPGLTVLEQQ